MKSGWSDEDARAAAQAWGEGGADLALRIYTSHLIGRETDLVLHGGGNTSLKSRARDLYGDEIDVIRVKASGRDLATVEPDDLPALRLDVLLRLRELDALDDDALVGELRRAMLDPSAPAPSLETLLHAFLPHRFVDHSHADAVLALTNQPDGEGEQRIRALFGDRVAWVPYVMAGFRLAKSAAEVAEKSADFEGLVIEKHGLFTFGDDARTSYERHIELVDTCERHVLEQTEGRRPLDARPVVAVREPGEVAPILRGALAELDPDGKGDGGPPTRWILEHRTSGEILHFAASPIGPMLAQAGPITPDHVIRTKGPYLFVEQPPYAEADALAEILRLEVSRFRDAYRAYFDRNVGAKGVERTPLDGTPRIVVLPGVGLFAAGATRRDARIAADIAEHTIKTQIWASEIGQYTGLSESDLFDMEYWSLEQAKLGRRTRAPLEGQIAFITGGAGAIGEGVARRLLEAGAHVMLTDLNAERLAAVRERLDSDACEVFEADVTDEGDMRDAFRQTAAAFGGVDLVVVNAGIARTGALEELELDDFQQAVDVNLNGAFLTIREALGMLRMQGTGGNIVLMSTKNVFAPSAQFGAYSASKAAAHQVGRIAALEGAAMGVRVNMINADAIFGTSDNPSGLWQQVGPSRAAARGISEQELEEFYRNRNLLRARVTAEHLGNAVIFFATQQTPTTGAVLPVDGGLPDAFPR